MFTQLYLQSTDPLRRTSMADMVPAMVGSIVFHTLLYTAFVNLVSFIFVGKLLSNMVNVRLVVSLVLIMCVGFVARVYHVQDIYRAYNYDSHQARGHIDHRFITWPFLS